MRSVFAAAILLALTVLRFAQADPAKVQSTDTNVIAAVLGKKITAKEKEELGRLILEALLDRYAKENKIEPTDEELDTFVRKLAEKENEQEAKAARDVEKLQNELKSSSLSDRNRKEKESQLRTIESILKATREMKGQTKGMEEQMSSMKRQTAQYFVKAWKINKALYTKYGGRVIFQQAGPEPLDAYRDFLKEEEKRGSFQILDKSYEASFWRYFTNDAMHTFYSKEDGAKVINTPWWMMGAPPEK